MHFHRPSSYFRHLRTWLSAWRPLRWFEAFGVDLGGWRPDPPVMDRLIR